MGMDVHLELWAADPDTAKRAARAAFERIRQVDKTLSDYREDSELVALGKAAGQGPQPASAELLETLLFAGELHQQTGGRFDVTVGPLSQLWRKARDTGQKPSAEEIAAAQALVGFEHVRIDATAGTVALLREGMRLDMGALGKGLAGDRALEVLREHGIDRALFVAGGDIVTGAPPPGEEGWFVDLPDGFDDLSVANGAVAISGDTAQFLEADGKRFSHVIVPRSGEGTTSGDLTVVRAPRGMVADALATCGGLLEEEEWQRLLSQHPGVSGWRR